MSVKFMFSAEDEQFREEVHAFLASALTDDRVEANRQNSGMFVDRAIAKNVRKNSMRRVGVQCTGRKRMAVRAGRSRICISCGMNVRAPARRVCSIRARLCSHRRCLLLLVKNRKRTTCRGFSAGNTTGVRVTPNRAQTRSCESENARGS